MNALPREHRVISEKVEYRAKVTVTRHSKVTVNPNGRGYAQDNVVKNLDNEVLEIAVRADSPGRLSDKVAIILGTIEDEVREQ